MEYGESVEDAVRREMREETGLELADLRQFHVYSDPRRDSRGHCVSVVFVADGVGKPFAGDDAGDVMLVRLDEAASIGLVFDHEKVLADYAAGTGSNQIGNQAG